MLLRTAWLFGLVAVCLGAGTARSQESGWCCVRGDLVGDSERGCRVKEGVFFTDWSTARMECSGTTPGEVREGWCCVEGVVTEMTDDRCLSAGGRFGEQRDAVESGCGRGGVGGPVITVTTTADRGSDCAAGKGTCSLREAIRAASSAPGGATIRFALTQQDPGYDASRGAWVLRFGSPLPALQANGVTVDGSSIRSPRAPSLSHAPPGCARPAVELDGAGTGMGLLVQGSHNTVRNLAVYGFAGPGIRLEGNGNTVTCCYLGTDVSQSSGRGNVNGVAVRGAGNNNHVGISGGGNLVVGNSSNGVLVAGGCTNTSIEGNLVGVAGDGSTPIPNGAGVALEEGSRNTRIGGSGDRSPGRCDRSCNVISGNDGHGVQIGKSDGNVVVASFIGVSADGTKAVGNRLAGVFILGGRANRVGGGVSGLGNVVSGNRDGVVVQGVAGRKPWDNTVEGNLIGTDATAGSPLPNRGVGVLITVGADKTIVGGSPKQGNVIAGNRLAGVRIDRGSSLTRVTNNWIGTSRDGRMIPNGLGVALYAGSRLNWIGGPEGKGNVIAYNNGDGVHVEGQQTVDNGIASNSIYSNLGKGISLVDGGNRTLPALRIWETNLIDAVRNEYYVVGQLDGITPSSPDYRVAIYSDIGDEGQWVANPLVVVQKAQQNLRFGWFGAKAVLRGNRFTFTVSDHLGHNTSEFSSGDLKPAGQGKLPFDMDYWQVDPDNRLPLNPHYHAGWGIHPRWKDIRKLSKIWSWDGGYFIECAEDQVSPGAANHLRGFLCGYFLTYQQSVMFTGELYWESFMDDGSPGFEDTDNNFGLWTPGMAGVHLNSQRYINLGEPDVHKRLECPGGSVCDARDWEDDLGESFHIGQWVEQTRYWPLLTLEINRRETFDHWTSHPFWGRLTSDGPHLRQLVDGKRAVVIGRWAMDGYHYCRSEVHPVFGMAVLESATTPSGPGREVWHFFMRRKGDQAVCGGWASVGGRDWYFRFKGRAGLTPSATVSNLQSNNWSGGVKVAATGPHAGGDVVVRMELPDDDDRVCGTVTIDWK